MNYKVNISPGNRKLGGVPSFSLPSGRSCSAAARETCHKDCYFHRHVEKLYIGARMNCLENYDFSKNDPIKFEKDLNWHLDGPNAPRLFRIHVGGDFYSAAYFELWLRVIRRHKRTRFLAFTKQFDIVRPYLNNLPKNLSLVASAWPDVDMPKDIRQAIPVAWMQDGTVTDIPTDAIPCEGHCETCGRCWALDGKHVVFNKH